MNRMPISILIVLLGLSLNAVPVRAEGSDDAADGNAAATAAKQKDECLLLARDCGISVQSIQDKIERLKEEIAKGTVVYTPEELKILKQKLNEVNKILDFTGNK